MSELPSPQTLAGIVNDAIQAMYTFHVSFADECARVLPSDSKNITVIVPLIGAPLYVITARADDEGGSALASVMYGCDTSDTNPEMIEDALRELCNITAGQLKSVIALDHEIGLSSRLLDDSTFNDVHRWSGVRLSVGGLGKAKVDVAIAEFEGFS